MESSFVKKKPRATIVIIDDNQLAIEVAVEALRCWLPDFERYEIKTTTSAMHTIPFQAMEIINELTGPALILVDYHMPGIKGLKLIEELRKYVLVEKKFLLVTGETSHEVLAEANRMGVDYFSKAPPPGGQPYNFGDLFVAKIMFMLEQLKDERALLVDKKTDAYTIPGLSQQWIQVWNVMKREKSWTVMLFVDVNDFKPINDRFRDHAPGDKVLSGVAAALREDLRGSDSMGRLGDEFVVLLTRIRVDSMTASETKKSPTEMREEVERRAKEIGERMRARVSAKQIEALPGVFISTSVSIGFVSVDPRSLRENPDHGRTVPLEDFERYMSSADSLMYEDKYLHYQRLMEKGDESAKVKYLKYKDLWEQQAVVS